jgi:hypothetical protein
MDEISRLQKQIDDLYFKLQIVSDRTIQFEKDMYPEEMEEEELI